MTYGESMTLFCGWVFISFCSSISVCSGYGCTEGSSCSASIANDISKSGSALLQTNHGRTKESKVSVGEQLQLGSMAGMKSDAQLDSRVPKLMIQYGRPRSATTMQFQALCVIMLLIHETE